jgi:hypothetical protein
MYIYCLEYEQLVGLINIDTIYKHIEIGRWLYQIFERYYLLKEKFDISNISKLKTWQLLKNNNKHWFVRYNEFLPNISLKFLDEDFKTIMHDIEEYNWNYYFELCAKYERLNYEFKNPKKSQISFCSLFDNECIGQFLFEQIEQHIHYHINPYHLKKLTTLKSWTTLITQYHLTKNKNKLRIIW